MRTGDNQGDVIVGREVQTVIVIEIVS